MSVKVEREAIEFHFGMVQGYLDGSNAPDSIQAAFAGIEVFLNQYLEAAGESEEEEVEEEVEDEEPPSGEETEQEATSNSEQIATNHDDISEVNDGGEDKYEWAKGFKFTRGTSSPKAERVKQAIWEMYSEEGMSAEQIAAYLENGSTSGTITSMLYKLAKDRGVPFGKRVQKAAEAPQEKEVHSSAGAAPSEPKAEERIIAVSPEHDHIPMADHIERLSLRNRTHNALVRSGNVQISKLREMTKLELAEIDGFGVSCQNDLEMALAKYTWRQAPEPEAEEDEILPGFRRVIVNDPTPEINTVALPSANGREWVEDEKDIVWNGHKFGDTAKAIASRMLNRTESEVAALIEQLKEDPKYGKKPAPKPVEKVLAPIPDKLFRDFLSTYPRATPLEKENETYVAYKHVLKHEGITHVMLMGALVHHKTIAWERTPDYMKPAAIDWLRQRTWKSALFTSEMRVEPPQN